MSKPTVPAAVVELIRKEAADASRHGNHARAVKALAALCSAKRYRKSKPKPK